MTPDFKQQSTAPLVPLRKKFFLGLIILFLVVDAIAGYVYFQHKKISADNIVTITTRYYGTVIWSDGKPAKGVLVSIRNHDSIVNDDGTYSNYFLQDDSLSKTPAELVTAVKFFDPKTMREYFPVDSASSLPQSVSDNLTSKDIRKDYTLIIPSSSNNFTQKSDPIVSARSASFTYSFANKSTLKLSFYDTAEEPKTVRTITESFDPGIHTVTWDYHDNNGALVPSGRYTMFAQTSDSYGTVDTLNEISIQVGKITP